MREFFTRFPAEKQSFEGFGVYGTFQVFLYEVLKLLDFEDVLGSKIQLLLEKVTRECGFFGVFFFVEPLQIPLPDSCWLIKYPLQAIPILEVSNW
jgi:hypothetical protein